MTVHVLLPCYDEAETLEELVAEIFGACGNIDCRIVAVDDGSTDATFACLNALSEKYPIVVLRHETNKGLHEAIRTLLLWVNDNAAASDYVVTMDSDLTHDPKYIPALVSACQENATDVAIASRFAEGGKQKGVPLHRAILSRGLRLYAKFSLGLPASDISSGYRCIHAANVKRLVEAYEREGLVKAKGFDVQLELLYKLFVNGAKITEIPFTLDYSKKRGKSKMKVRRTIGGYLETISRLKRMQKK